MSELNRPETPGPWGGGRPGNDLAEQDILAIADLPAWIEAHDALRSALLEANGWLRDAEARAEKAEAALREVWRILDNREHSPHVAGENAWGELIERGYGRPAE